MRLNDTKILTLTCHYTVTYSIADIIPQELAKQTIA